MPKKADSKINPPRAIKESGSSETPRESQLLKELADIRFALDESSIVAITDQTGKINFVNDKFCNISGYSREELLGQDHRIINSGYHPAEFIRNIWTTIAGGKVWHGEIKNRAKNGSYYWVDTTMVPFVNAKGKPYQYIAIRNDITERKQIQEKNEQLLKELFDIKFALDESSIVAITDQTGKINFVNDKFCEISGYSREELLGQDHRIINSTYHPKAFIRNIWKTIGSGKVWKGEIKNRARDGSYYWVDTTIVPFLNEKGKPYQYVAIRNDITERKRSEERYAQLAAIVESSNDAIIGKTLDGTITSWNTGAERMYGYTAKEMIGNKIAVIVPPEYLDQLKKTLKTLGSGGNVEYLETERVRKDGVKITVAFTGSSIKDADGKIIGCSAISRDITEHKELEEQFRQSQKMEAVGKLAGGIAHDFNNLLTAINGYSELCLRNLPITDPLRSNLEEIKKAGDRAAALTNQLLAFSRKQVLQPQIIVLNTVVSDLEKMLKRLIGEDIELKTILDPELGTIKADPGQIGQVILNLAVNARDAIPGLGKLTIETKNMYLDQTYTGHHLSVTPGNYIMLAITDTGCGMDEETQEHIFEPFFTTKKVGEGTGLGLSTVYGIIKQSGGNVWVYSELGKGTTFKIYLPRVDEHVQVNDRAMKSEGLRGNENILLVEDEEMVRKLSRKTLESYGYTVLEAQNGVEALSLCEQSDRVIDLLLTDVVMPQMGGRELADILTKKYPQMSVLFTSGYTDDSIVRNNIIDEGTNFIQKPFTLDALAQKVRESLNRKIRS